MNSSVREKLKRQIQELTERPDIQKAEIEELKGYSMEEGDYHLIVNILEASELISKNDDYYFFKAEKTACDSYVIIESMGVRKFTQVRKQTNNPIFDSKFNLSFKNLSIETLKGADIVLKVVDRKSILLRDAVLGQMTLDWTSLYFQRNHEYFRTWFVVCDPMNENDGVTGFVLASIALLGPNDKQTIHDSGYIKSPLTVMEGMVMDKKVAFTEFLLEVQVYRAEGLAPYNILEYDLNAYVVLKFCGLKVCTRVQKSKNPEWNESLSIATYIPNKCKFCYLELWNHNKLGRDDLIGVVAVDFADLYEKGQLGPQYANIYGPPIDGKDSSQSYATDMVIYGKDKGSHFIGRLLFMAKCEATSSPKTQAIKLKYEFPYNPAPVVPQKNYSLLVELIEGFQISSSFREYSVHVMIGTYLAKSRKEQQKNSSVKWYQTLEAKSVHFPTDADQIPDIVIYLSHGDLEKNRISFCRLRAKDYLIGEGRPPSPIQTSVTLIEDKSLDLLAPSECPGFIRLRLGLYDVMPPVREPLSARVKSGNYELRVFLLIGRSLISKNESGTSDPFVEFRCAGQSASSEIKFNSLNPNWFQQLVLKVELEARENEWEKPLLLNIYDWEETGQYNFMGKTMLPLSWKKKNLRKFRSKGRETRVLFSKSSWHTILGDEREKVGNVLVSYLLVPAEDAALVPPIRDLRPKCFSRMVQIYILGLRQVEQEVNDIAISKVRLRLKYEYLDPKSGSRDEVISLPVRLVKHKATPCENLIELKNLTIYCNKNFPPLLEIYLDESTHRKDRLVGYQYVNLYETLPKLEYAPPSGDRHLMDELQKIEEQSDDEETIPDVEEIKLQVNEIMREKHEKDRTEEEEQVRAVSNPTYDPKKHGKRKRAAEEGEEKDDLSADVPNEFITDHTKINRRELEQYDLESQERLSSILDDSIENIVLNSIEPRAPLLEDASIIERSRDMESSFDNSKRPSYYNLSAIRENNLPRPFENDVDDQEESELLKRDRASKKMSRPNLVRSVRSEQNASKEEQLRIRTKKELSRRKLEASRMESVEYSRTMRDMNLTMSIELEEIGQIDEELIEQKNNDDRRLGYKDIEKYREIEEKMRLQALKVEEDKKVGLAKLSMFFFRADRKRDIDTYEQFDTDPEEDLDLEPEWFKCRKRFTFDFEEKFKLKKLHNVEIRTGKDSRVMHRVALMKCIFLSYENALTAKKKEEYYNSMLRPRTFVVRVYVLKGKSLISEDKEKPTTYLRLGVNELTSLQQKTLRPDDLNPAYYITLDVQVPLPGPSFFRIEVMEKGGLGSFSDSLLGYTELDLENRYLTKKWHYFEHKPIELRNLYNPYGTGCQGRLETWFQIIELKYWKQKPPIKIEPPPYDPYELRVIVWDSFIYQSDSEKELADVFVRGNLGAEEPKVTDTHWRCKGKGSFNWRWKFKVSYPPKEDENYTDKLQIQLFDRNIAGHNTLIGESTININGVHRIIEKACKRKKTVEGKVKVKERGGEITNKIWFNLYNSKQKDEFGKLVPQGKICLSFEILPIAEAERLQNSEGRSEPNIHPILPEPEGRLSFDFLHPLKFLEGLMGEDAYNRCCLRMVCVLVLLVVLLLGYLVLGSVIGGLIVK